MEMIIDSLLYYSNGTWGEDRLFSGEKYCGVIDGATPIDFIPMQGFKTQAEWFAQKTKEYFERQERVESFPDLCFDCMRELRQVESLQAIEAVYNLPSATIAAVIEESGVLSGYVLGDCGIDVCLKNNTILRYTDPRVSRFSKLTLLEKNNAIRLHRDASAAVRAQKIKNRAHMNEPGGYWTIAPIGDFRNEFVTFRIPLKEVKKCILYTDGYIQACQMLKLPIDAFLSEEKISEKIRRNLLLQNMDFSFDSSLFVKKNDDIALFVLDFEKNGFVFREHSQENGPN